MTYITITCGQCRHQDTLDQFTTTPVGGGPCGGFYVKAVLGKVV